MSNFELMDLVALYEDKQYLVNFDTNAKLSDEDDMLRISYSKEDNDNIEYRIKIFLLSENGFTLKRIKELPEIFTKSIAHEIEKISSHTFIANPYFDDLLIFYGIDVYTSQDKLKPITCDQCQKRNLYEKRNKDNKADYLQKIRNLLQIDKPSGWPYKENLLLQFTVSNTQSYLKRVDLDNIAKTIFDGFNGIIYEDDKQIVSFAGDKESVLGVKAFIVAIRKLKPKEKIEFQKYLYSGKLNAWKKEYEEKIRLNKPTRFMHYSGLATTKKENSVVTGSA